MQIQNYSIAIMFALLGRWVLLHMVLVHMTQVHANDKMIRIFPPANYFSRQPLGVL